MVMVLMIFFLLGFLQLVLFLQTFFLLILLTLVLFMVIFFLLVVLQRVLFLLIFFVLVMLPGSVQFYCCILKGSMILALAGLLSYDSIDAGYFSIIVASAGLVSTDIVLTCSVIAVAMIVIY